MNVSNPHNSLVIELLLNPNLLREYNKLCADLNLIRQCPFSTREFPAIQWQLYFPHLVVAQKGNEQKLTNLTEDFFDVAFPRMKAPVIVGDYIRAPMELRHLRPHFGLSGLFANITAKEIPLDDLTAAVGEYKFKGLLTVYNMAVAASPLHLDPFGLAKDWRAIKSISDALALCVVISYRGREATSEDQPTVDYLGDIIYETWHEIDRMLSEPFPE
jgi:hypothetical protein